VLLSSAPATAVEEAVKNAGWIDLSLATMAEPKATTTSSSTEVSQEQHENVVYLNIGAMLACRVLTGLLCAPDASTQVTDCFLNVNFITNLFLCKRTQFVTSHAPIVFESTLNCLRWCSNDGALHALIQCVHNQLDRLPSLCASSHASLLTHTQHTEKMVEFSAIKLRVQVSDHLRLFGKVRCVLNT
jgi:hypothetical protein